MLLVLYSLLVQFAAAIVAICQARRTGRAFAWSLIACAIALMAVRRVLTLIAAVGPHQKPIDPAVEGIALLISLLLLLGLIGMGPLLSRWSTAAADAAELRNSVFNAAQAEIAVLDRTGTIIEVNQAWTEFSPAGGRGPTPPYLGWNYLDVCRRATPTCPEAAKAEAGISEVLAGSRSLFEMTYAMATPEGLRQFFLRVAPLTGAAGGAVASHIELTRVLGAEQRVRELEARFRQLAEGISEVFWLFELAPRKLLYVSPSFERLWGISTAALQESPLRWQETVHPEDRAMVAQAWAALTEPEGPDGYDIEYRIVRPDGALRWIHDRATLTRSADAAPTMVSGVASDVTDRHRSEAAERELHHHMRALIEASPLPIVALSATGDVTGWNPAAERSFGWRSDEVLGRYLPIVPPDLDHEYCRFRSEVLSGAAFNGRLTRRQHKDGTTLDVMISTAPTCDASGRITGLVAIYEDVTGRLQLEERQRQLQLRLTESQKLESLGVLAGGIAHDFNNLLTIIQGNSQLARGEVSPTAPVQSSLEQIEAAVARAAELTAQMLTYAGKGQFQVVPLELAELVASQRSLLEGLLPAGATLQVTPAPDPVRVNADPAQLRQVLVNLVNNAVEAIPTTGGAVVVSVSEELLDEATLERSLYPDQLRPGRCAVLEVSDTGSGMEPEMVNRMFEPFVSSRFVGRGLGLAAVAGIIRRHHGTATVESAPGRGTTVRIFLPLPERIREPGGRTTRSAGTVLMVDDEKEVLRLMGRFLERAGFEVLLAPGGAEALALHRERRGNIDVVILDLTMPGMSGEATLAALRQLEPELPVIFTSGYTRSEVLRRCGSLRISGFLLKPYLPSELTELVREVLRGGRPHPVDSPVPGSH